MRERKPAKLAPNKAFSEEIGLRLGVHDSSRIEWTASVDLPARDDRRYRVEFSVEIPANTYSIHDPWEHLQINTRLQSPSEEGALRIERDDVDELRRDTLGIAHRLKQQRDRFARACQGAASQLVEALHPSLEGTLKEIIDQMVSLIDEMRRCLAAPPSLPAEQEPEVKREWELADEFLSHQLLDALASAEKQLEEVLLGPDSRLRELDTSWTDRTCDLLAAKLEAELEHRRAHGFITPRADSPAELGRFVERGSRLKKHFQDVLFLETEAYMVDYRLRNVTGIVAACLAAAWWLTFTAMPIGAGVRAGFGVGTLFAASAAAYALKDRVKELSRGWLAGRLMRLYGQRMVKLRLPARIDRDRQVLVETRETVASRPSSVEDALNSSARRRVMLLHFEMRGEVHASRSLQNASIHSIKHIFRYDLSPLFARFDDAVKSVPVLDAVTHRVRFAEAPKEYRFPVCVSAWAGETKTAVAAWLVCSKRGIERIAYAPEA
jgi:hypothetical protein